jgi:hypothetical protein
MPDHTGAVDIQVEIATDEIIARALAVLAMRAGGRLRFTLKDRMLMPRGTLAHAFDTEEQGGGLKLAWIPMSASMVEQSKEKTVIALPDSSIQTSGNETLRTALSLIVLENGSTTRTGRKWLYVERQTAEENRRLDNSALHQLTSHNGDWIFLQEFF